MIEADRPERVVRYKLPRKLAFLREMHPYKIAYGGRNGLKSTSFADVLLEMGIQQDLRILCAREVQKSLKESVHQLLVDRIQALDYGPLYKATDKVIRSTTRKTSFLFAGLSDQTVESMKSFEGIDVLWAEEAQRISKRSWQIALPTLFRTPNAECWVSMNPDMDTDESWERFIVNPPAGAMVVEMNWRDAVKCGFFPPAQEALRQRDLIHSKADYDNIWEGKPRTVVAGAIYATEIVEMITERRIRPIPYDPRLPVHRIWDLGWNDLMVAIMVQKPHPSALNVINYLEEQFITYPEMLGAMDKLRYRWGTDWLPHDGEHHHPTSGTNARKILTDLGCKVRIIPKTGDEPRIRAARMMFPRAYIDNSKFETSPDRPMRQLGAGHLVDRLKRFRRMISKTTNEAGAPAEDINIHAADAWGGLAEIVDRIRNENEERAQVIPEYENADSSMGMLG